MIKVINSVASPKIDKGVLFPFDTGSIPFSTGLRLQLINGQSPYNGNPIVLRNGNPGEPDDDMAIFYGTVLNIDGELRMWYQGKSSQDKSGRRLLYATSTDGVHWEKPSLGLIEFNGNSNNNIVDLFGGEPCLTSAPILHDPDDPDPNRRFKMAIETGKYGNQMAVAYSPDGFTWTESPNNPVAPSQETGSLVKIGDCYYIVSQDELGYHGSHFGIARKMLTFASYDFENWTQASCLGFRRDNIPPRPMSPKNNMAEEAHQGAMLWDRGNVVIGVYDMWHGNPLGAQELIDIDLGLVITNDGLHYTEPIPDFKLIPAVYSPEVDLYPGKSLCHGHGPAMLNLGDETLMWYGGFVSGQVRLARWKKDRLGYFETFSEVPFADGDVFPITRPAPHLITCPIQVLDSGAKIYANLDASDDSPLTIELLDEHFNPINGYSGDNSAHLNQSGFNVPVTWTGKDALPDNTSTIRLRVTFGDGKRPEDCKLYAIYIE